MLNRIRVGKVSQDDIQKLNSKPRFSSRIILNGLWPKNAKIGSEVDFHEIVKKCPTGQGGQKRPKILQ